MAEDEIKELLLQVMAFLPTLATKADVAAVDAKLSAQIGAVDARLSAQIGAVDAKVTTVDAKVEEVRHVSSANHFKLVGRIDQVASMLGDHMAEHDHRPLNDGRKRA